MDLAYKILASLGGISFIVSGILAWLGKVYIEKYKSRLNKEYAEFQSQLSATNEKIRAKLDNSVYVTKAYFDKELSAYNAYLEFDVRNKRECSSFKTSFGPC